MRGVIETYQRNRNCMWIAGDDGKTYFSHGSEVKNTKNIKKGNIVIFDSVDEGKDNLRAVNIVKVGHGIAHPFICDIERVKEFILDNVQYSSEMEWRLRDLERIENYLAVTEDYEALSKDVDQYGPKKIQEKNKDDGAEGVQK